MTKSELVALVSEQTGLARGQVEVVLGKTFKALSGALARGEEVRLADFGSFQVKARAARTGRNPRTGEPLMIPASKNVGFKASKALKDEVNG